MISEFLLLRIPGTSTWYFKIQLLFYFVIAVAAKVDQKHMPVIVAVLAFAYAILGKYFGLPDYWWKTAMCFPAGCIVADSRERISRWALQTWALGAAVLFVAVGYVYILKDSRYVLLPQLLAFSAIAAGIALIWNRLAGDNKILRSIGKYSLACYLLHIGIVDYFFVADTNINVKMVSFAITVGIGTWICNTISEKIYLMMRKSRKCV